MLGAMFLAGAWCAEHVAAQSAAGMLDPFRAFSWVPDGSNPAPRVTPFVGVNIWDPGGSHPQWAAHADPAAAAETLALRPAGQRVMFVYGAERFADAGFTNLFFQPQDNIPDADGNRTIAGIWPTYGTVRAKAVYDDYFGRLKATLDTRQLSTSGVDGLVLDMETNWSNWSMTAPRLDAIQADARYAVLQTQLAARHPDFNSTTMSLATVIDFLRIPGTNPGEPYLYWNAVMKGRINAVLNEAVYAPFRERFAGASVSNYESARIAYPGAAVPPPPETPLIPEPNGHYAFFDAADGPLFGDTGAPVLYGWVTPNMPNIHPGVAWLNPYTQVIVAANQVRAHAQATFTAGTEANITPWLAPKSWQGESGLVVPWASTAYYDEMVRQAVLGSGKTNVFYWNSARTAGDDQALSDILADIRTEFRDQQPLETLTRAQLGYGDPSIIGAVRFADGRIVGRVTFSGTDQTVSFQLGSETLTVAAAGEVGRWFTVVAVPEPSAFILAGLAAACLAVGAVGRRGVRPAPRPGDRLRTLAGIHRRGSAAGASHSHGRPAPPPGTDGLRPLHVCHAKATVARAAATAAANVSGEPPTGTAHRAAAARRTVAPRGRKRIPTAWRAIFDATAGGIVPRAASSAVSMANS